MSVILVVGSNCGTEEQFFPNSGKPVLMKAYALAGKLGKIGIDGIIGIPMERLFGPGNLRIRVVYFKLSGRRVGLGRDPGFDKPQPKVLENLRDDLPIFYKADDPHGPLAFRTGEGVDFVDFLDKTGPVFSVRLQIFVRFQDTWNQCIPALLLASSATNVAIIPIVTDHLFTLIGNMGAHGRQPL